MKYKFKFSAYIVPINISREKFSHGLKMDHLPPNDVGRIAQKSWRKKGGNQEREEGILSQFF